MAVDPTLLLEAFCSSTVVFGVRFSQHTVHILTEHMEN